MVEKDINDESLIKFTREKNVIAARVILLTNNATKTCLKPNVIWKVKDYSTKNSRKSYWFFFKKKHMYVIDIMPKENLS